VRHAGARQATVTLRRVGDMVEVTVADDGRGINQRPNRAHHYGMTIMRERSESLNGELTLQSPPGGGTRVGLRFRQRAAAAHDLALPSMHGAAN
jgi:nitrate/nitrite-specific signal transduction histidine kinase